MTEDRCICCGKVIPEGRMVCCDCERITVTTQKKTKPKWMHALIKKVKVIFNGN